MGGCGALVCVLVLVQVQCARPEDYSGLRGAVRHVEDAIRKEMMIEPVRYSDPNLTLSYQASTQFKARGMANLYKVTNFFMDIIQREDPYPEGKCFFFVLGNVTTPKKLIVAQAVKKLATFYGTRRTNAAFTGLCSLTIRHNIVSQSSLRSRK
jgi:hypothetical protein